MPSSEYWHCGRKDDHPKHPWRKTGTKHGRRSGEAVTLQCPGGPFKPQGKNTKDK